MKKIINRIKNFEWENRVHRTGFLQSKDICNEAEITPIHLTKKYSVCYRNIFWIQDYNLYDNQITKKFNTTFTKAFSQEKDWPYKIMRDLDISNKKIDKFIKKLKENKNKIKLFNEYVKLLLATQKYYVIAVPLVSYCEEKLKDYPHILKDYATPYKALEVDKFQKSRNSLQEFAWIKTAYNIIEELSPKDIYRKKIKKIKSQKLASLSKDVKYLVDALQIGIYMRNRMKELSQKLWYYIEPTARQLAGELNISRDNFFLLTHQEVNRWHEGKGKVSKFEIAKRKKYFAVGFLNKKKYIISGSNVKLLINFFSHKKIVIYNFVNGVVACNGTVKGRVKIILNKNDFYKLNKGDILVTPMTTPDFIVLMRKAAAIVTDEGGLSCHAAIVSRELKIPCIIGTKNATKVFTDGDLVTLDGNKGLVVRS